MSKSPHSPILVFLIGNGRGTGRGTTGIYTGCFLDKDLVGIRGENYLQIQVFHGLEDKIRLMIGAMSHLWMMQVWGMKDVGGPTLGVLCRETFRHCRIFCNDHY